MEDMSLSMPCACVVLIFRYSGVTASLLILVSLFLFNFFKDRTHFLFTYRLSVMKRWTFFPWESLIIECVFKILSLLYAFPIVAIWYKTLYMGHMWDILTGSDQVHLWYNMYFLWFHLGNSSWSWFALPRKKLNKSSLCCISSPFPLDALSLMGH